MYYLIGLCLAFVVFVLVDALDPRPWQVNLKAHPARDLLAALLLCVVVAAPLAALWWVVTSMALAARH